MAGRAGRVAGVIATGAALSGCTGYRPVTVPAVAVRDDVQVELTAPGGQALVSVLGPGVRVIEGVVRERTADGSLRLVGTVLQLEDGDRRPGPSTAVVIPPEAIQRIERRALDRPRTRITVAAVVGGFTAVVVSVLRSTRFRGQGQTAQGPGVPE